MSWKDKVQKHLNGKKPSMKISAEVQRTLISDLKDYENKWSPWESDFIANIEERLDNEQFITDTQCDTLQKLWDRMVK